MSEEKPLKVSYSKQFVRDLTDLAKRSPNVLIGSKYITAIYCLLNRLPLPENYQDHALVGRVERLSRLPYSRRFGTDLPIRYTR